MNQEVNKFELARKMRATRLFRMFRWWVGIPTLLAIVYYGLIASDYYESVAKFSIQSTDQSAAASLDTLLASVPGAGSNQDALMVKEYILSRDVLERLDSEHAFLAHYQDAGDWFSKLSRRATFEDAFDYYLRRVAVDVDIQSGVSTLEVRALTAEHAARFATAILKYSEALVNRLSDRAERDRLDLARSEVAASEKRLTNIRSRILREQMAGDDINPAESAAAILAIRNELEAEHTRAQAELTEVISYMREDSPKAIALKNRIESLQMQIDNENRRLISPDEDSLSSSIAGFEPLLVEKEFAEKAYESALTSLEIARADAAKQHRYLATIASPYAPDTATHPKRMMSILTVLLSTMLAFGIGSLLIAAIREHARI